MIETKHIILFDGECNFCSFWVKYVIKRDKKDAFRFASLQSEIGQSYLKELSLSPSMDSIVLITQKGFFVKSTAVLNILRLHGGLRSILYSFIIIPVCIRDFFYDLIAKHRYRFFGKQQCELPLNNDYKNHFLS